MDTTPKHLTTLSESRVVPMVERFVYAMTTEERMNFLFRAAKFICMNCCRKRSSENEACGCEEEN